MAEETKVDVWMPLYVSDFLTATLGWSAEERGHYMTLLMAQWAMGGLPSDMKALERITPGLGECWGTVGEKFSTCADGKLRNRRLEEHRTAAVENREKKVAAAHAANEAKRLKREAAEAAAREAAAQSVTQTVTGCTTQTDTQTVSHSDMPSPSPSPSEINNTHTHTGRADAEDDWRKPGWAADEWDRWLAEWNATERAARWNYLTPPDRWLDMLATPGWIERAREALAMLPSRRYFATPLAMTKFFEFIDRIRAGEFAEPAEPRGGRAVATAGAKAPRRGNL